jgi:DNA end-binding protein Ku
LGIRVPAREQEEAIMAKRATAKGARKTQKKSSAKKQSNGRVWSGAISFGLINIPVGVETAEQGKDLHFNLLDKRNLAHIKYKRVNEKTGKEVPYDQTVKGYHHPSGKYVVLTDEDFRRANPKASKTIDIQTFVKMEDIDPLFFERPYYLVPQKGGEKGYSLLNEALVKSKKVAVATVVMRTKEYLTCVFPREGFLFLEILRFSHNLKKLPSQLVPHAKFKDQELKMAEQLVEGMTSKWKPDQYKDTYYSDLKKHIEKKLAAGKGKAIEEVEPEETEDKDSDDSQDLMSLLKASLKKKSGAKSSTSSRSLH